jgi:hypothetical protein
MMSFSMSDLAALSNIGLDYLEEKARAEQERLDEDGGGAALAAMQWKQTKKGRWRRRRGFRIMESYGGIDRAENPWWTRTATAAAIYEKNFNPYDNEEERAEASKYQWKGLGKCWKCGFFGDPGKHDSVACESGTSAQDERQTRPTTPDSDPRSPGESA